MNLIEEGKAHKMTVEQAGAVVAQLAGKDGNELPQGVLLFVPGDKGEGTIYVAPEWNDRLVAAKKAAKAK